MILLSNNNNKKNPKTKTKNRGEVLLPCELFAEFYYELAHKAITLCMLVQLGV